MVVSDFDAFIHGCTILDTKNFVNIDSMSGNKTPRSCTGARPGTLSGPSYKDTRKRKYQFKDPLTIDYGVTTKSQVHFRAMRRTRQQPLISRALAPSYKCHSQKSAVRIGENDVCNIHKYSLTNTLVHPPCFRRYEAL